MKASSSASPLNDTLNSTIENSSAGMDDPPTATGTGTSASTCTSSSMLPSLKVTFQVAENESVGFSIPISSLEEREAEMRQTAGKLNVPANKWNSSRLYEEYLDKRKPSALYLVLHKPWINQRTLAWIRNYYLTGTLQIPSQAHGYDVLAALEYFSILYSPNQCHFADYAVYERVQQWARYLSLRDQLTELVVSRMDRRVPVQFATTPHVDAKMVLAQPRGRPRDGPDDTSAHSNTQLFALGDTPELAKAAHKLLNRHAELPNVPDDTTLPNPQEATAHELRQDLCAHLMRTAVIRHARFDVASVQVHNHRIQQRSVLTIEPVVQQQKQKLVFLLPEELGPKQQQKQQQQQQRQLNPNPYASGNKFEVHPQYHSSLHNNANTLIKTLEVVGCSDNNTVTSGLTGPFYTDETGQKRDVYADDDTFAEAKRHEWVQTALMNRGIHDRMEELLHPPPSSRTDAAWEWWTGLGVCEMSRSVMESMEQYVTQVRSTTSTAHAGNMGDVAVAAAPREPVHVVQVSSPPVNTEPRLVSMTEAGPPLRSAMHRKPSLVKDRLTKVQAMTNGTGEFRESIGSKESPRGVADDLYRPTSPSAASAIITSIEPAAEVTKTETKKERGWRKLFRRRRGTTTSRTLGTTTTATTTFQQ